MFSVALLETVIPILVQWRQQINNVLKHLEFSSCHPDNALLVSQLENDIFDLVVTDLKQGVQATIDGADPAGFISRQGLQLSNRLFC
ncbi:hypothetical protein O9992_29660 [Vibrio lentus]|nr:hypothetical protein [Vibrio lentus]